MTDAPLSDYLAARQSLLAPPLNGRQLSLREVRRAGWALAGSPNDLSIYGLKPVAWYLLGVRILGRTAVELTRDPHAAFIAAQAAKTLAEKGFRICDVIDLFAGSGNLLFHILKATKAGRGVGLDLGGVLDLTRRNFARLRWTRLLGTATVALHKQDWSGGIDHMRDRATLIVIDPPWGMGLDPTGLDLRKTAPPVMEILEKARRHIRDSPVFALVKTYPQMVEDSAREITQRFETFPTVRSENPAINGSVDYLLLRLDRKPKPD
jgi:hypothetical protein